MEDCIFCKIIAGSIFTEKIYEDEHFVAFLDNTPLHVGHTLLVPKKHCRNLFDMTEELLQRACPVLQKLARAIQTGTQADGINIGWNNEQAAGQVVFHAHIHIMPRYRNDGHIHWKGKEGVTNAELADVAVKIKTVIR